MTEQRDKVIYSYLLPEAMLQYDFGVCVCVCLLGLGKQ